MSCDTVILPFNQLSCNFKAEIMETFKQVRDSPTEALYTERKAKLFELTSKLLVRPKNLFHFTDTTPKIGIL